VPPTNPAGVRECLGAGHDRQQQDQWVVRIEAATHRFEQRWIRLQHGVADHAQHYQAEKLHHRVHHALGVAQQEDADDQHGGDQRADYRRDAEDHIHRQAGATDVADVEGDAAKHDEGGYQMADTGYHAVGDVLAAQVGNGDHPPDIKLGTDVDELRDQDREGETRQILLGEQRRLG